ncbi:uncharacterized protein JCM6883_000868 [Sporobolomyces salmoneus]|uniref:uncharacterized protein n=1 Tax=Sporobolomyces salmoneus TaxID=183962 RepID=UPI00317AFE68
MEQPPRPLSPPLLTAPEPLPPTQLPTDPTLLSRYLRSTQLASLRHLYAYKTDQLAKESAAQYDATRGRGGRARRRRGSSPLVEEKDPREQDENDLMEVRKKFKWDPTVELDSTRESEGDRAEGENDEEEVTEKEVLGTAETLVTLVQEEKNRKLQVAIDPVHTYDLVYDLYPDLAADAYYHGPHPEPPARVVRTILRATREKPFINPEDLSTSQLESLTDNIWRQEGKSIAVNFGTTSNQTNLTREEQRIQKEMNLDEEAEWEENVIAGFSATCHERIGKGMAKKPMGLKEIQDQANHLHQQQVVASASVQGPPPPPHHPSSAPNSASIAQSGGPPQMASQLPAGYGQQPYSEREYQNAMAAAGTHWR